MSIRRAMPLVHSTDLEAARSFYVDFLGFQPAMDEEGFLMLRSPSTPTTQVLVATDAAHDRELHGALAQAQLVHHHLPRCGACRRSDGGRGGRSMLGRVLAGGAGLQALQVDDATGVARNVELRTAQVHARDLRPLPQGVQPPQRDVEPLPCQQRLTVLTDAHTGHAHRTR